MEETKEQVKTLQLENFGKIFEIWGYYGGGLKILCQTSDQGKALELLNTPIVHTPELFTSADLERLEGEELLTANAINGTYKNYLAEKVKANPTNPKYPYYTWGPLVKLKSTALEMQIKWINEQYQVPDNWGGSVDGIHWLVEEQDVVDVLRKTKPDNDFGSKFVKGIEQIILDSIGRERSGSTGEHDTMYQINFKGKGTKEEIIRAITERFESL